MRKRHFAILLLAAMAVDHSASLLDAAKPWERLVPFKRVEASPDKDYGLTEGQGPWMIMASSFAGPGAEKQARQLVLEIRRDLKLPAYVHRQTYDFSQSVVGKGLNRYGGAKKMRYANATKFDEIAVLVGDFPNVDDPLAEKVLQKVRTARPDCLDVNKNQSSTQRFVALRESQKNRSKDPDKKQLGPMGLAFVTRNPLLPREYFSPGGLDPLVEEMNRGVEYSLLENPGRYTVRVATFRGASTMKREEIEHGGRNLGSKLEQAAAKAHELTTSLRQKGVDAYEFHDRYESIVTVGSFETLKDKRNGLQPEVVRLVQQYGAQEPADVERLAKQLGTQQARTPGQGVVGLIPRSLNGICYDVEPKPIEVPRRAVAAAYAPSNRLFN